MVRGYWKSSRLALIVAAGALLSGVGAAQAADLGGDCCADLEERVAELEATTARKGNRKVSLTVSGFVNETLIFWDDGFERNVYQATNEIARSRFRFLGEAKIDNDWTAGYLLELGVRGNRLNRDNQNVSNTGDGVDVRHSAIWLASKTYGKLWLGQTSQATDFITEVNLANYTLVTGISKPDSFSGFLLRTATGAGTNTYRDLLQGGISQTPGEGDRFNLVKYETPAIAGFIASASTGQNRFWDVALRYAGEFSGFKVAAGAGYGEYGDANGDAGGGVVGIRGCAISPTNGTHCTTFGASGSVLHVPTGLFVFGAYGRRDDNERAALFKATGPKVGGADKTDEFWSVEAGIEQNWFGIGKTDIWGERWTFNGGAGVDQTTGGVKSFASIGGAGASLAGSNVTITGVGFDQSVDAAAMDFYVLYHHVESNTSTYNAAGTAITNQKLHDFDYVLTGALIRF